MFKNKNEWVRANKLLTFFSIIAPLTFVAIYTINLGRLVSTNNIESIDNLKLNTFNDFVSNIAFAPSDILIVGVNIFSSDVLFSRLISATLVLISILVFYLLIKKWHTPRVAFFATILFAVSSYSLHLGRLTNIDVLYYIFIPLLILMGTWLKSRKTVNRFIYIVPILALLMYLPGAIIIILSYSIFFRRRLGLAWKFIDTRIRIISLSLGGLILIPLIYSLLSKPAQILEFLAIDNLKVENLSNISEKFLELFPALFYNGVDDSGRWLYGTPILDVGTVVLLVLGIYSYIKGNHTLRYRLLLSLSVICIVVYILGGLVTLALLMPIVYILAANGISFLLQTWFTVFPKNPAARNVAIVCMVALIAIISSYHLQRYFNAWPNAPETKALSSYQAE